MRSRRTVSAAASSGGMPTSSWHAFRSKEHAHVFVGMPTLLIFLALIGFAPRFASAQETKAPAKAEGVFDDKKDEDKPKEKAKPKPAVSDRDSIGFTQENVASQMTELEGRMFRLSEALRSPGAGERVAPAAGAEVLAGGIDPPADEGDAGAPQGGAARQGRDGGPGVIGEARTPPQPPARRGPRLPDEARQAPPDARGPRPARPDHQGREARAGLVTLGHRAAEGTRTSSARNARPGLEKLVRRPEGRRSTTTKEAAKEPEGASQKNAKSAAEQRP